MNVPINLKPYQGLKALASHALVSLILVPINLKPYQGLKGTNRIDHHQSSLEFQLILNPIRD